MARNGKSTKKQRFQQGETVFKAFQHLYGLSENMAESYLTNFHNSDNPINVVIKLHQALVPSRANLDKKLDSLEGAIESLGDFLDTVPTSPECEGVFTFKYNKSQEIEKVEANTPNFEDYVKSLEFAGAWKGERPSKEEIKSLGVFSFLKSIATYVSGQYDLFCRTEGYKHVQELSHLLRDFIESSPKENNIPAQRLGFDILTLGLNYSQRNNIEKHKEVITNFFNDPSEIKKRLHGNQETEGVMQLSEKYHLLDDMLDLEVLDMVPYSGKTGPEHLNEIAPKLKNIKSETEGHQRVKTLKTLIQLLRSTDLDQREDLLDIVDRSISEQKVDSVNLYKQLQSSGLKPEEYIEFLRAGDQFGWRPEGSDLAITNLSSEYFELIDPVTTYLMVKRSGFNIINALREIASNKGGVPAVTELIRNPSLLFLDDNAIELMTLARDYEHGKLIIERYSTVKANGLDERAEAILHVGRLRPSGDDLSFIRKRMRTLPENEIGKIMEYDTVENIKKLLKTQKPSKDQKPIKTEGVSSHSLMIKRMIKRGATEESISAVEEAHEILLNHGGNPRLLRNALRTQPRSLGDLCNHISNHQGNETFRLLMKRDSLFQRYKFGLATDPDFAQNFSSFVEQDHSNPFQALQNYLPIFPINEEVSDNITPLEVEPMRTIEEFPGKIVICGGKFKMEHKRTILRELPGIIFSPDGDRLKKMGLQGLNENDGVLWIIPGTTHSAHDKVKGQCQRNGAIFELSRTGGLSIINIIKENIINRKTTS